MGVVAPPPTPPRTWRSPWTAHSAQDVVLSRGGRPCPPLALRPESAPSKASQVCVSRTFVSRSAEVTGGHERPSANGRRHTGW